MTNVESQNLEAEEHVLGAMMLSPSAVAKVIGVLEPEFFYRDSHGIIFEAARDLFTAGVAVDPITLSDALERRQDERGKPQLELVGGMAKIYGLAALLPTTANVLFHAEIIREHWKRRSVSRSVLEAVRGIEDALDADAALVLAERELLDLRSMIDRGKKTVVPIREAAQWFGAKTENPPEDLPGVDGPFRFLPKLVPGRLYVLGGYPADGKTAVGVQFAQAAARGMSFREGRQDRRARVGIVSIEMSWRDLTDRIVTSYGVPYRQAQSGRIVAGEARANAAKAVGEMLSLDIDLIDDESADAAAIWRYQRLGRYDFLIVDHVHRIDWDERRDLEKEIKALTSLARREEVPVLALSQLRRDERFARPTMGSFRESGVIEQEAALACAVWRHRDSNLQPTNAADFVVVKNRFGRIGSFDLVFKPEQVRYVEKALADAEQEKLNV